MRVEQRIVSWVPWLPLLVGVAIAASLQRSTKPAYAPAALRTSALPPPVSTSVHRLRRSEPSPAVVASTSRRARHWLVLGVLAIVAPLVPAASNGWLPTFATV